MTTTMTGNRKKRCHLLSIGLLVFLKTQSHALHTPIRNHVRIASHLQMSSPSPESISRRQSFELAFAAVGLGTSFFATRENSPTDYGLYGVLPLGPYKTKKSLFSEVVPSKLFTVDQKFGILNVQVPIRMSIIPLEEGGLLIYDPVAGTPEVVSFIRELEGRFGPVKHIVVGSVAAEHKVYGGVLAQKCLEAKVWLTPGQYAYPVDLPIEFLGFPRGRTEMIPLENVAGLFGKEFEYLTLGPFISRDGAFGETVLLHKPTKSLLVTDTVIEVTDEVPAIYDSDPKPLLYHARDTVTEVVEDTPEVRKRGWRRITLFGLYFTPQALEIKDADVAWRERRPDINPDFLGIYPWDWVGDDIKSFKALQGGLLVAPILQQLILNRNPIEVLDFADQVSNWKFERIIPAHFMNDLKYDGKAYRDAFTFLEDGGVPKGIPNPLEGDMKLLVDSEVGLLESGAIAARPPFPGGKVSRAEILKQEAYGCRANICTPRSSP